MCKNVSGRCRNCDHKKSGRSPISIFESSKPTVRHKYLKAVYQESVHAHCSANECS